MLHGEQLFSTERQSSVTWKYELAQQLIPSRWQALCFKNALWRCTCSTARLSVYAGPLTSYLDAVKYKKMGVLDQTPDTRNYTARHPSLVPLTNLCP